MLNSKLLQLQRHFGLTVDADWQSVTPAWILSQDGIGPKTLEYIRLLLAIRGMTLKDDRTPEYWQQHLQHVRISDTLGNETDFEGEAMDRGVLCPFVVLIDSAEQSPLTFQGFKTDADQGNRPLIIPTETRALGRFPDSLGDYSLESTVGGVGRCHIERKSMEDAHGTILGFKKGPDGGPSRRERFEKELSNLAEMESAAVVVECDFQTLIAQAPVYGQRSAAQNAKTLHRSVLAWMQDYHTVPWLFCGSRRMAEKTVFQWIERWFRKQVEERKEVEREQKKRIENLRQAELEAATL